MSKKEPSINFIGKTFGYVTILEDLGHTDKGVRMILGKCKCGVTKKFNLVNLKTGKSKSCGCFSIETRKSSPGHRLIKHPLYGVWNGIKQRCRTVTNKEYKFYGGRGIDICNEWFNDFLVFYNWAIQNGWSKGLEIDRKDNNLGYCPENCRFITQKQNCNNRRDNKLIEYNGQIKTISEWSDFLFFPKDMLYRRLKRGWSMEKSLNTPKMVNKWG